MKTKHICGGAVCVSVCVLASANGKCGHRPHVLASSVPAVQHVVLFRSVHFRLFHKMFAQYTNDSAIQKFMLILPNF